MGNAIIRTFNLHASSSPIIVELHLSIKLNGETKTVLLLFIDDKIDTGAMILSSEIEETENAGQLHDRLMDLGSKTVIAS
jgi:methionyl-tRNA formyltransferase